MSSPRTSNYGYSSVCTTKQANYLGSYWHKLGEWLPEAGEVFSHRDVDQNALYLKKLETEDVLSFEGLIDGTKHYSVRESTWTRIRETQERRGTVVVVEDGEVKEYGDF